MYVARLLHLPKMHALLRKKPFKPVGLSTKSFADNQLPLRLEKREYSSVIHSGAPFRAANTSWRNSRLHGQSGFPTQGYFLQTGSWQLYEYLVYSC